MEIVIVVGVMVYLVFQLSDACRDLEKAVESGCSKLALVIHLLWILLIGFLLVLGGYLFTIYI